MSGNQQEQSEAKLLGYVEGDLTPADREEIEKHLESNPHHRRMMDELGRTRDLLRFLPRESPPPDLLEQFQIHLERSVLLDESAVPETGAMKINRWYQVRAAAAVLLLASGLGVAVYFALPPRNKATSLAERLRSQTNPSAAFEEASSPGSATAPSDRTFARGHTFAQDGAPPEKLPSVEDAAGAGANGAMALATPPAPAPPAAPAPRPESDAFPFGAPPAPPSPAAPSGPGGPSAAAKPAELAAEPAGGIGAGGGTGGAGGTTVNAVAAKAGPAPMARAERAEAGGADALVYATRAEEVAMATAAKSLADAPAVREAMSTLSEQEAVTGSRGVGAAAGGQSGVQTEFRRAEPADPAAPSRPHVVVVLASADPAGTSKRVTDFLSASRAAWSPLDGVARDSLSPTERARMQRDAPAPKDMASNAAADAAAMADKAKRNAAAAPQSRGNARAAAGPNAGQAQPAPAAAAPAFGSGGPARPSGPAPVREKADGQLNLPTGPTAAPVEQVLLVRRLSRSQLADLRDRFNRPAEAQWARVFDGPGPTRALAVAPATQPLTPPSPAPASPPAVSEPAPAAPPRGGLQPSTGPTRPTVATAPAGAAGGAGSRPQPSASPTAAAAQGDGSGPNQLRRQADMRKVASAGPGAVPGLPRTRPTTPIPAATAADIIRPGDPIQITCTAPAGSPLAGVKTAWVGENGTVPFAPLGAFRCAGLTPREASDALTRELRARTTAGQTVQARVDLLAVSGGKPADRPAVPAGTAKRDVVSPAPAAARAPSLAAVPPAPAPAAPATLPAAPIPAPAAPAIEIPPVAKPPAPAGADAIVDAAIKSTDFADETVDVVICVQRALTAAEPAEQASPATAATRPIRP